MKKVLVAALAITAVGVTAASAQTTRQQQSRTPAAYTVIEQGQVRGADPDPWVRFELLRENDPTNGNG
jgi:hypothetical protein